MPNRLWIAAVVAVTPIMAMSRVAFPVAHEAGCVRAAQGARHDQRAFMSLMKSHGRKDRVRLASYKVDRVPSSDIELITEDTICAKAAVAYGTVVRRANPSRRVSLLKIGDRYVVKDPDFKPDKHHRSVTFDSTLTEPLAVVVE
jgi:hypothetical protein